MALEKGFAKIDLAVAFAVPRVVLELLSLLARQCNMEKVSRHIDRAIRNLSKRTLISLKVPRIALLIPRASARP